MALAEMGTARAVPGKFRDPLRTADGSLRARITLRALDTLWFNTGTLCNLECANCYIESSPLNDRLAYLTKEDVAAFLDEIERDGWNTREIGFTGGEPFMNPDIAAMLADALSRGYRVLVLTNAMTPMRHRRKALKDLRAAHGGRLVIRVSLDHFTQELHEEERGPRSWAPTIDGLKWLSAEGFPVHVAGRSFSGDGEAAMREGYARLFAREGIAVDAMDPEALIIFPEMDETEDVPEITEACWNILGVDPASVMCASSRMVVKRKGQARPAVVSCTLLPYEPAFELGETLASAERTVALNHPHCAKFCVLGGAACSRAND